jgi:hypothetical protein
MISKILCLTNALVKMLGRKMTAGFFWSVLAQVATDLSPNGKENVESRTKKSMSVKEILLAEMTTAGMLDGERVRIPAAEEAQAMGELEPHTLVAVN